MHFKNDVLSEFRKVRSSERLDLLCSLLDACLPFELRFLGTCLEFLGKRDFNELREDERLANNVNHISQFRSLSDENTRRKLVLYVSLLKSSNSDCVNYFSDILTGINMEEVGLVHGTVTDEPSLEAMNKLMDELLLLYTIAVNHPAFTIHQKSKFAVILAQLQDEDKKLCGVRRTEKDLDVKYTDFCQPCVQCEGVGESPDSFKINDPVILELPLPGANQESVHAQVCHISPTYSSIEAPSPTLSQGSNVSLSGPPPPPMPACQVIESSVCGHITMTPPVQVQSKTMPVDLMSTLSPMGDRPASQASLVMPPTMQPAPAHIPPSGTVPSSTSPRLLMNHNMMAPVAVPQGPVSTSSHCIIQTTAIPSGDLNMTKHTMIPPGLLNMSPDSMMHMPFPAPWGVMMHMTTMGNPTPTPAPTPTQSSSPTSGPAESSNIPGAPDANRDGPPVAPGPGQDVVTPLTLSRQSSPSSSRAPTPPRKTQFAKGHAPPFHNPNHHLHTGPPPLLPQPPQSAAPVVSAPAQPQTLPAPPPPPPPPGVVPPPPVTNAPPIPMTAPNSVPPPAPPPTALAVHPPPNYPPRSQNCNENWDVGHMPMESCKEDVPKYLTSLQDFSPDELRHMDDEELKERGMPPEVLAQLRSCVNRQQAANGLNCSSRDPEVGGRLPRQRPPRDRSSLTPGGVQVHDSRPAWRIQGMDAVQQVHPHLVPMQPCYSGQPNFMMPCTGRKVYRKSDAGFRQLSQQLRSVRIEDERRPCSNGSSASDSSVGSHSPPDTPVLSGTTAPHHQIWDRGHQRKDSIGGGGGGGGGVNESWQNSTAPPEERLHEDGRPERIEAERNERTEWTERGEDRIRPFPPPTGQRNTLNRPRGLSKGNPPGIQTISRGRGHHGLDKNRREAGPLNGEMTPPGPFPINTPLTVGNNVPYTTPVSSFISHIGYSPFTAFRPGNYMPPNQPAYPYHHNGEMWNQFPQNPHPSHNFIRHMAFSPAMPPPKVSCYNCGAEGHVGADCKELTLEEITQQGQFHLDYKPQKESGDCPSDK